MNQQELLYGKHKCLVCDKTITATNTEDHIVCLKSAYSYEGTLSYVDLLQLFFDKDWIVGPYGRDVSDYTLTLQGIDESIATSAPVFTMLKYALAFAMKEKSKPKPTFVAPPDPTPADPAG